MSKITQEAIFNELFLELYAKWRPGIYWSSSKNTFLDIKDMNSKHIENVINELTERRQRRQQQIASLEDDGDIVSDIKKDYRNQNDVITYKILELQRELSSRDL